ncbi:hypothetical protein PRIPAC_72620 [Pristionchus pacificus]|uniref:Uncharacterized protein n=1 Tax=Pristionchus pacificus TaxID=54126 RepID=A0A2A6C7S2_PRIPA|nr:hypothetical protein PRIPAC_72620 [Pristionchus pacificus]|eukprot:PDM74209.1 hypothetical protein PRIPAC_41565 [Pristionchus pacificus]
MLSLPLLLLLLSLPLALPVSIHVIMSGNLICSAPFTANITLMEDDPIGDDVVTQISVTTCEHVKIYNLAGDAEDSLFQNEVELYLKISHNCPDTAYTEYCHRISSLAGPATMTVDIAPGIMEMTHCKFFE